MSQETIPLVPQAKPVYLDIKGREVPEPPDHRDSHPETKWHNPTDKVAVLNLFVGTPVATGRPPRNYEEKTGLRRIVLKPGETRSIPSEFDMAIQHMQCKEAECLQRPFDCKDPEHVKEIVGGLNPWLVNLGMQHRPTLHPSLDDEVARATEAERKELDAWRREKKAAEDRARAVAEKELADQQLQARAKSEAEADVVIKQHQPKNETKK